MARGMFGFPKKVFTTNPTAKTFGTAIRAASGMPEMRVKKPRPHRKTKGLWAILSDKFDQGTFD